MTLVAGIDSSTQSCKVVIRDLVTGATIRSGNAPHPEGTAVDANAWWDALLAAIADAGGLADVAAVSVSAQQHGMVALDAHGLPVHDALLWNDTRSGAAAAELVEELGAEAFASRTGIVPVASFTITKLRWLADARPELAARVAAVALPHDWLTWRLRGFGPELPDLGELTTDHSDASGTGYVTVAGENDRELLGLALRRDVRRVVLPRVLPAGATAGVTAPHPGIPSGIPIGVGCGDNAGAALGLDAGAGDIIVSLGTSGVVTAVTETFVPDSSGTVAGFADATGRRLPLVATMNAARVLDVTARLLGVSYDEFADLALAAPSGSGGLVLRPYFEGERTPNLPDGTATLFGMTSASLTRECVARAAVEGMVCGLADGLDALVAFGAERGRILLIGGAAQNAAVQRVAAEVFAQPITVPEPGEYVASGAAVQAAWALTGERPHWLVAAHEITATARPEVRAAYAATPAQPLRAAG